MEFICTVGPPGCGKSTWADQNLPPSTLRLERDRMREAFWNTRQAYHDDTMPQKSNILTDAMYAAAFRWPEDRPIALTDTCVSYGLVAPFWQLRQTRRIIIFDLPAEELRHRNNTRPEAHRLPPDVLENYIFEFHRKANQWWTTVDCTKEIIR